MGTLRSTVLATGPGWSLSNVVCSAGPADRPFEERHDLACVAAVLGGTFQYRSAQGAATLAPGSVLLGNPNTCFECGHAHGMGDRCLSFRFAPDLLDAVLPAQPGARRMAFAAPCLPPSSALTPLLADLAAAAEDGDGAELEELGLRLAGAALAGGVARRERRGAGWARDARRVADVVRWIETRSHEALGLSDLAGKAGLPPFRLLRSFQSVVGMTPHQYLLRTRLHHVAVRLRRTQLPVSVIAFDAGFGDLSTFNHRFRRIMGANPSEYRRHAARRS